ncbi:MAG: hypothetical protein OXC93_01845 [Rhodospirillaceae bacterium]|nr:hypothetical protein [Rhodospirillaceae bacterium]
MASPELSTTLSSGAGIWVGFGLSAWSHGNFDLLNLQARATAFGKLFESDMYRAVALSVVDLLFLEDNEIAPGEGGFAQAWLDMTHRAVASDARWRIAGLNRLRPESGSSLHESQKNPLQHLAVRRSLESRLPVQSPYGARRRRDARG